MTTKKDIFKEKLLEYLKANNARKGGILDAVIEVNGLKRKKAKRRIKKIKKAKA